MSEYLAIIPMVCVWFGGILTMLAEAFRSRGERMPMEGIAMGVLLTSAVTGVLLWGRGTVSFGVVSADNFGLFVTLVLAVVGILTVALSSQVVERDGINAGEYYALTLFAIGGMMLMATATDLLVIFIALEILSLSVYILTGIRRESKAGAEAAFKYFLLGGFSSAFFLYGIAFTYGIAGTTRLDEVVVVMSGLTASNEVLSYIAMGLLLVGFAFKVSAVPFHMWTPDAYEGAPAVVTAFMSAGVKAAAFAAFVRVFMSAFGGLQPQWEPIIWVLSAASMILGAVAGVVQRNVRRMLAYSSIAHAGYLLVGLTAADTQGVGAVLFAVMGYAMMTLGAFSVVIAVGRRGEPNEEIGDYAGLGFRYPFLGFCMTVFMLSLSGIPLFVGFTSKFFLFSAAIERGYVWLVVIAALNSVVSIYYYMSVLVQMYMGEGDGREVQGVSQRPYLTATLLVTSVMTIALGIFPGWLLSLATAAVKSLSS